MEGRLSSSCAFHALVSCVPKIRKVSDNIRISFYLYNNSICGRATALKRSHFPSCCYIDASIHGILPLTEQDASGVDLSSASRTSWLVRRFTLRSNHLNTHLLAFCLVPFLTNHFINSDKKVHWDIVKFYFV